MPRPLVVAELILACYLAESPWIITFSSETGRELCRAECKIKETLSKLMMKHEFLPVVMYELLNIDFILASLICICSTESFFFGLNVSASFMCRTSIKQKYCNQHEILNSATWLKPLQRKRRAASGDYSWLECGRKE